MFASTTKTSGKVLNGVILFAVVLAAAVTALAIMKIKVDPKDPTGFRNTLGLKKK